MNRSVEEIANDLDSLGLLDREHASKLLNACEGDHPDPHSTLPSAVDVLVSTGQVTEFQARKILHGKAEDLLIADYLILEELGRGGMGQVYVAMHRSMQRKVALKTLNRQFLHDPRLVSRFEREIKTLGQLQHNNIVTAHDAGSSNGVPYLVTELVQGEDLQKYIDAHGPIAPSAAVAVLGQLLDGIGYAHRQGVVHRDVKPGNLILSENGTLKILDLGLARILDSVDTVQTRSGQILGTPGFMAPEQAAGIAADERADIFSIGRTLRFLVVGYARSHRDLKDRESDAESQFENQVPRPLLAIYKKMVAVDPEDRYQSVDEVVGDIDAHFPLATVRSSTPGKIDLSSADSGSANAFHRWRTKRVLPLVMLGLVVCFVGWLVRVKYGPNLTSKPGHRVEVEAPGPYRLGSRFVFEGHEADLQFLAFSTDSQMLASGAWDGELFIWDVAGRQEEIWHASTGANGLTSGLFLGDGQKLVIGRDDGNLQVWDLQQQKPIGNLSGHKGELLALTRLDGQRFASGDAEGMVKVWSTSQLDQPTAERQPHRWEVAAIVYDQDRQALITGGGGDGFIRVWNLAGEPTEEVFQETDSVYDMAYASGTGVLYAALKSQIVAWRFDDASEIFRENVPSKSEIASIDVSESRGEVVAGLTDGYLMIFNAADGELRLREEVLKPLGRDGVKCLAYSPDGKWLAAGGVDSVIYVWRLPE